ncbi:hypothetical protein QGN32_08770 [Mycolicibacterium sp. ND9-15]|uniref:hypothetical protein n=1 Tax=Mycolicibacterium sp. ND9-15 TaxID=3042320 RepID=UPI002DDA4E7F|nr:hypothetical protein [Mycolicibacterium sp. ND9-15]WSE57920.1 hypothetical protein QGN32_08770 [Mycolicibacterium sp. ND9-15]
MSDASVREDGQLSASGASTATVERVLVGLLEDLADASPPADRSDAYRMGYSMGIRFARICVLDEIAAKSGSFVRAALAGGHRPNREQARTRAALRRIAARLSPDFTLGGDDRTAGYRDATAVALELISRLDR